jgi:hypothetical protein
MACVDPSVHFAPCADRGGGGGRHPPVAPPCRLVEGELVTKDGYRYKLTHSGKVGAAGAWGDPACPVRSDTAALPRPPAKPPPWVGLWVPTGAGQEAQGQGGQAGKGGRRGGRGRGGSSALAQEEAGQGGWREASRCVLALGGSQQVVGAVPSSHAAPHAAPAWDPAAIGRQQGGRCCCHGPATGCFPLQLNSGASHPIAAPPPRHTPPAPWRPHACLTQLPSPRRARRRRPSPSPSPSRRSPRRRRRRRRRRHPSARWAGWASRRLPQPAAAPPPGLCSAACLTASPPLVQHGRTSSHGPACPAALVWP